MLAARERPSQWQALDEDVNKLAFTGALAESKSVYARGVAAGKGPALAAAGNVDRANWSSIAGAVAVVGWYISGLIITTGVLAIIYRAVCRLDLDITTAVCITKD